MIKSELHIGQIVNAFNTTLWKKKGDIGNNSCFWQEAEVLKLYQSTDGKKLEVEFDLCDVKFLKTGIIIKGYYTKFIKKVTV